MTTTTADIDLAKLETLARAATAGPWKHYKARLRPGTAVTVNEVQPLEGEPIVRWPGFDGMSKSKAAIAADARYIAAANPRAILALIQLARRSHASEVAAVSMDYRTCCSHPACATCAGQGGFYRLRASEAGAGSKQPVEPLLPPSTQPVAAELLQALQHAAQLLRAAGFAMSGTCSSKIIEAINKLASAQTLPEREMSKPAVQQGIFRKFDVRRVDGSDQPSGKHYGCRYFVLDLDHDQHAPTAMRAYAAACAATHPQLASDIAAEFGAQLVAAAPAKPITSANWTECERIADIVEVDAALRGFSEDPTGDNGTIVVRTIVEAAALWPPIVPVAPVATVSVPVPHHFACPQRDYNPLCAGCEAEHQATPANTSLDSVVEANRELLLDRSRKGIETYGTTLAGAKLPRARLLQHALEESLDLANYIQALIQADADKEQS